MAEIEPGESASHAGDKTTGGLHDAKTGNFYQKHKIPILAGGAGILIAGFIVLRNHGASGSSSTPAQTAADTAAATGIDPQTGYEYGSPADVAALGGSGTVSAIPGPSGATGAAGSTGATGATGPAGSSNGLVKLTFAQAQALAGKSGSSSLYYTSGGQIVQGKYANDKNVTYYAPAPAAIKAGAKVPA
jgi:hypothetical protein